MKHTGSKAPVRRVEHPKGLTGEEHVEHEGGERGESQDRAEHGESHAAA